MMRTSTILGAAALAGAAWFARKWRQNYKDAQAERALYEDIPEDAVTGLDLLGHLDDLVAFDDLAEWVCMQPCCYTPLSEDQVKSYGYDVDFE